MNNEQFTRSMMYGASRSLSAELLARGVITGKEYDKVNTALRKKYQQNMGAFCTRKP